MLHDNGCRQHRYCKRNVLQHLLERLELTSADVLAVGDGDNDVCLLRSAGQSIAFDPKSPVVRAAAHRAISGSLANLLSTLDDCSAVSA
jgi:phosphoserine phosphatase